MKKLIFTLVFTFTLPISQIALSQDTTDLSDAEMADLQANICGNSAVDDILLQNNPYESALTDALVKSGSNYQEITSLGNTTITPTPTTLTTTTIYNDGDEYVGAPVTVKQFAATTVDTSIMPDPTDTSAQNEVTNACL